VGDQVLEVHGQPVATMTFEQMIDHILIDEPLGLLLKVRRGDREVHLLIQRARVSDIMAADGYRLEPTADSTNYRIVPLNETPAIAHGDVAELSGLHDSQCSEAQFPKFPQGNTVIYFWASWCGPCKGLINRLKDEKIDTARMRIVGFNVDETCDRFHATVDSLRPPGAQLWTGGWYGSTCRSFRLRSIPTTALLDREGRLITTVVGVDSALALIRHAQ
jgi:thiol-disulfide isomerase/thioredoxin